MSKQTETKADTGCSLQRMVRALLKMNPRNYILDDKGNPVIERDLVTWARWMENFQNRRVADERIGDSRISTVFLSLDHNWSGVGPPVLWETMVFGGKLNEEQDRCSGSREQAEAMHARMVEKVKCSNDPRYAKRPTSKPD